QNQLSAVVPYSVAGKASTTVQVALNGLKTNTVSVPVTDSLPGIFTASGSGVGPGAILNEDFTVNSPSNPAPRGSIAIVFATGEGQTDPAGVDGQISVAAPLPAPRLQPVTVLVGGPGGIGKSASVLYAGAAPSLVSGVLQVNFRIPADSPVGNVPLLV